MIFSQEGLNRNREWRPLPITVGDFYSVTTKSPEIETPDFNMPESHA